MEAVTDISGSEIKIHEEVTSTFLVYLNFAKHLTSHETRPWRLKTMVMLNLRNLCYIFLKTKNSPNWHRHVSV